jgi:RHS repeat-associated protein
MSVTNSGGLATVSQANGAQVAFQYYSQGATEPVGSLGATWCPSDATSAVFCPTAPREVATLSENVGSPTDTWTFTNNLKNPITYEFSSAGVLDSVMDAGGDTLVRTVYAPVSGQSPCPSGDSCVAWSSTPTGQSSAVNVLVQAFDSTSQLVSVFDAASGASSAQTATFAYTGSGCSTWTSTPVDLCSVTDPGGLKTTFSYDSGKSSPLNYDVTTVTPPQASGAVANTFDSSGRVIKQMIATGGISQETDFAYSTDANFGNGTKTQVTSYPNGTGGIPTTATNEFSNGVLVRTTDGSGAVTSYQRDQTTLLPTVTVNPNGQSSSQILNNYATGGTASSSADPLLAKDPAGNTTQELFTPANLVYCAVDAADYANGVRCPASAPTSPPTTATGYTTTIYNAANQVTFTTDPLHNTTAHSYTTSGSGVPAGLMYCVVDPVDYAKGVRCPAYGAAHVTGTATTTFDSSGNPLSSSDPDGNTTTKVYGSAANPGLATQTTDPDGTKTTNAYDAAGHVLNQVVTGTTGTYSATTQFAYDSAGRKYCEVDPYEYAKSIQCPTTPPTSPPTGAPSFTDTIYNSNGQVASSTSPIGGTTLFAYDGTGNKYCTVGATAYAAGTRCPSVPLSTPIPGNDPYLGATVDNFDGDGRVSQETSPIGGITTYRYDPNGNKISQSIESDNATSAPTVTTNYAYDADNRPISTTVDPGSSLVSVKTSSYDPNGNVYCSVSANAYAAGASTYQCPAWQSTWITAIPSPTSLYSGTPSSIQANAVTMGFYDANGNLRQQSNPDKSTTVTAYDGDGHPYCTVNALDLANWLTSNSGASYPYLCPASAPPAPPAPGSNPNYETKIYDPDGRTISDTDANGNTTTTTYDPSGSPLAVTNAAGKVTASCYYWEVSTCASGAPVGGGAPGALLSTTSPPTQADIAGLVSSYTYFPGGTAHATTSPSGTSTAVYDAAGDLLSTTYSNTASGYATPANVSYTYFADGSRKTMTDGTGVTTSAYDASGNLLSQGFAATSGNGLKSSTTTYGYYTNGSRKTLTYPPIGSVNSPVVTYTYDATGAEASLADWQSHTTSFSHDADGNSTSSVLPNATTNTTSYNLGGAVTKVSSAPTANLNSPVASFGYQRNAAEQVSSEADTGTQVGTNTYTYSPAAQLASVNGAATNYDPAGNPIQTAAGSTQGFDAAGELTSASTPSASTSYTYDTLGDRTTTSGPGTSTKDSYNQAGELASQTTTSTSANYIPTSPTRICYTVAGNPSGLTGTAAQCNGKTMGANSTLNVQVTGSGLPVPAGATAVVANVTLLDNSSGTFLTAYASGSSRPSTANLNATKVSDVVTNQITVGLGPNGANAGITIYNALGTADVIVDVEGYYTASGTGSQYVPLSSQRICDTHSGNPSGLSAPETQCNAKTMGGNSFLAVQVTGTGYPVPAGASSVIVDVTAVNPSANTWLTTFTAGQSYPGVANLFAVPGSTVDKETTVALSSGGAIDVYNAYGTTDVYVDVEGYFTAGANQYVPVASQRICDTRSGNPSNLTGFPSQCNGKTMAANSTLNVTVTGLVNVPSNATAVVVNLTEVSGTVPGTLTMYPAGSPRPTAPQVTFTTEVVNANEVTAKVGANGQVTVYDAGSTADVIVDLEGYYIPPPALPLASSYSYNGDGLRMSQTISSITSTFAWDTTGAVGQILEDGPNAFVYGPNGSVVEQVGTTGVASYFLTDQLGSTRMLTNGSGAVVATYAYGSLGNVTSSSGSASTAIGFAGGYTDPTGLVYLVNRYYDPATGEFLSVDPLIQQTQQPYIYAGDNPVNATDPNGMLGISTPFGCLGSCGSSLPTVDNGRFTTVPTDAVLSHIPGTPSHLEVYTPFYNRVRGMTSSMNPKTIVNALSTLWGGLYQGGSSWADNRLLVSPDPNVENVCQGVQGDSTQQFLCNTVGTLNSPLYDNYSGSVSPELFAWYAEPLATSNGVGTSTREGSLAYMVQNMYSTLFSVGQYFLGKLESEYGGQANVPDWLLKLIGASDAAYVGPSGVGAACQTLV